MRRKFVNSKFAKALADADDKYTEKIARVGHKLNPASSAVEAGQILFTGEDFKGVKVESPWNRIFKPLLDIGTTFGASGVTGFVFDAYTWLYSVPDGVIQEIQDESYE